MLSKWGGQWWEKTTPHQQLHQNDAGVAANDFTGLEGEGVKVRGSCQPEPLVPAAPAVC